MAFKYSKRSSERLADCHPKLQDLFNEVIKHVDCTIIEAHRNRTTQNEYYRTGKSKLKYPESKHNQYPSKAVDVAPYPISWSDTKRFYFFAGIVKGVASQLGIGIRWGGDWDSDNDLNDQTFMDLVHFELLD